MMELLKQVYYIVDYTLQFVMWLVIGRVAAQFILRNPNNFVVNLFVRFTEPFYILAKKIFPFARVSENKKDTVWGYLDGCIPLILIFGIFVILRPLIRIIVSVIVVNAR